MKLKLNINMKMKIKTFEKKRRKMNLYVCNEGHLKKVVITINRKKKYKTSLVYVLK